MLFLVVQDNLTFPESPEYDKVMDEIMNEEYEGDVEDEESDDNGKEVGDKKDEAKLEEAAAAKSIPDEQKETSIAAPSNWKKKKNQRNARKQAKKPRVEHTWQATR